MTTGSTSRPADRPDDSPDDPRPDLLGDEDGGRERPAVGGEEATPVARPEGHLRAPLDDAADPLHLEVGGDAAHGGGVGVEAVADLDRSRDSGDLLAELKGLAERAQTIVPDLVGVSVGLIDEGLIPPGRMKRSNVHSVSDDALMNQLGLASKLTISRGLLLRLKDAGYAAMGRFLTRERGNIGKCSTIDLRAVVNAESARV